MRKQKIKYRRPIVMILLLLVVSASSKSQAVGDTYDGIVLEPSNANTPSVYYGEPYSIFFRYGNTTNTTKQYFGPGTYINIRFTLKNMTSGQQVPNINDIVTEASDLQRKKFQTSQPSNPYEPNEIKYFEIDVNKWFGIEKLVTEKIRYNGLMSRLQAIPVGKYEFTFEYDLFPGNRTLKASYRFEVLPLPASESEAFSKYVKATYYANNAHAFANKNYNANHPDSYDNFIKKFSGSIFAPHAYLNMVSESYYYSEGGPTKGERSAKFKEYLAYYPQLKNNRQKMVYVIGYVDVADFLGKDMKKELNNFLYSIRNEHPAISEKLIGDAEIRKKVKGLTNHAKK